MEENDAVVEFELHNGGRWFVPPNDILEIWSRPKDNAVCVLTRAGHYKAVKGPIEDVLKKWQGE